MFTPSLNWDVGLCFLTAEQSKKKKPEKRQSHAPKRKKRALPDVTLTIVDETQPPKPRKLPPRRHKSIGTPKRQVPARGQPREIFPIPMYRGLGDHDCAAGHYP